MSHVSIRIDVDGDKVKHHTSINPQASLSHLGNALGQLEMAKMILLREIGKISQNGRKP